MLTIFKASAGSGKTFTLAIEYIKLLIENPEAYRSILAVTFTNKATEEMKMRILSQLYGLWRQLPDSEAYMERLLKEFKGSKVQEFESSRVREYISKQAGRALHLLLDNYHFFRVQTIDTFFQSVLRNLAHELQLNANLRVGIDQNQIVNEAVDDMIDSIADDAELRKVVMEYVRERISNDQAWNFIEDIKVFGRDIFKDFYKEHRDVINEKTSAPNFFREYKDEINEKCRALEKKYDEIADEAAQILEENGLTNADFSYYKNGGGITYFDKLREGNFAEIDTEAGRLKSAKDDPDTWVAKKAERREEALRVVRESLHPLMLRTEQTRTLDARYYSSAEKTLKHVNDVQLLRYIEEFAKRLNEAAQRFMLSDTPTLLSEMVKDDDSPFIFEKTGAYLEHIMIDEFQDTSTIQWNNFKKLLIECLSKGKDSLIVGDVKQSIYRWRAGDWRLLNNIDQEFAKPMLRFEPLNTNYRSDRSVICFNNVFFEKVAKKEASNIANANNTAVGIGAQLDKAYADVSQEVPEWKPQRGLVHIELIPKNDKDSMPERTLDIIHTLQEKGAKLKDIAILLRSNKDIIGLGAYLEENGIKVISAEAFQLDASASVRTIIEAMKYMAHPKDELTYHLLLKDAHMSELPQAFVDNMESIITLSLHDMAERIVQLFHLGDREGAYITTFFDELHNFCTDDSNVLEDFLRAWDDGICTKKIETPDSDGVRLLTIHKSKGLEFGHVILPYCNWQLERGTTLWCEPQESPFNKLPIVPLAYSSPKSFEKTIYAEVTAEEHAQSMVDNLNLLYVAMTRACSSLFVIGMRGANENYRSRVIEDIIREGMPQTIDGMPLHIDIPDTDDKEIALTYGSWEGLFETKEEKRKSDNVFLPDITPVRIKVSSAESTAVFRQSNKSLEFADDAIDDSDRQRYIKMGTVMHMIFSQIATLDDIDPVLRRMEFDGTLYDDSITKKKLLDTLSSKFQDTQVREWFSDKWTLYNECTIITPEGEHRPDRVMTNGKETIVVDFKFGKMMPEHHQQVMRYITLLRDMGMPDVKGYLWYVSLNKIEKV
jgi:ATP-dependent exoDNAse (exonuclease V) beta subunit